MSTTQDTEHVQLPVERSASSRARTRPARSPRSYLILLGALLLAAIILFSGYQFVSAGQVFRGVSVGGVELGNQPPGAAQQKVESVIGSWQGRELVLQYENREWRFKPADLGLQADSADIAQQALMVGRRGNLLENIGEQVSGLLGGFELRPRLQLDQAKYSAAIQTVSGDIDNPPVDAGLVLQADGTWQTSAESAGRALDRQQLAETLTNGAGFGGAVIQLPVNTLNPDITKDDLAQAKEQAAKLIDSPVVLKYEDKQWKIDQDAIKGMLIFSKQVNDGGAALIASLDETKLNQHLDGIAQAIDVPAVDAKLVFAGSSANIEKESEGTRLDVEKTRQAIVEKAANGDNNIDVVTKKDSPAIKSGDLGALKKTAESWLSRRITLADKDTTMTLTPDGIAGMIQYSVVDGPSGKTPVLNLSTDQLDSFVKGLAEKVNVAGQDARFRWKDGKVVVLAESQVGHEVDVASTIAALDSAIRDGKSDVQAVIRDSQPKVLTSDKDKIVIREELMQAETYYTGSTPSRAHNVELAANRLDGVLVPPGGEFSFDKEEGPTTLAAGFQMGYGITTINGKTETVPAEAGGICQVSTTLFHTVFWAGLEVTERHEHPYWIPLYGQPPKGMKGLDATVFTPAVDFRFKNNTGNWLAIKTTSGGGVLRFTLYGTNPGWDVKVTGPVITDVVQPDSTPIYHVDPKLPATAKYQLEFAQAGFTASIHRVVTKNGEVINDWTVISKFAPASNEFIVGTAAAPTPTPTPEATPTETPTAEPTQTPAGDGQQPTPTQEPQPTEQPQPTPETTPTPAQ